MLVLITAGVAGCVQDDDGTPGTEVPAGSHEAYGFHVYLPPGGEPTHDLGHPAMKALPATITGLESEALTLGVASGAGIAIFGNLAFVGPGAGPMSIVDISDPTDPQVLSTVDAPGRDIDTIAYPDGRLIAVSTAGGKSMVATDVTDPSDPEILSVWEPLYPSHNLAVVPGTPIVYNSPSSGTSTDIWDLSDPLHPVMVNDWENGHGCHDLMFFNDPSRSFYRAYCAGIDRTQIWNTTDPSHPEIITTMAFPPEGYEGQSFISHMAMPNVDATVLVVGDETSGNCEVENALDDTPLEFLAPKHTNLWFYDITDEKNPIIKGQVTPELEYGACINHFGRVVHDREVMIISYYRDGILVVDFEDVENPYIVTQHSVAGSAWDAWYYQGYVFTGGGNGGMEVLSFV